ncbi:MAG: helix-turn-helix domain-containing protein [Actinomycetota bacterium]
MTSAAVLQRFSCIDAQAEQLTGFDQQYAQVDPGRYRGSFFAAEGGQVGVFVETTNRTLLQHGACPNGHVSAVALLGEGSSSTSANGTALTLDDVLLVGPGGAYDARVAAGAVPVVIDVDLATAPPTLARLASRLGSRVRRISDPALADRCRRVGSEAIDSFDRLALTAELPEGSARRLLLDLLVAPGAASGSAHRLLDVFRSGHEAMERSRAEPITMAALASTVGVSRRTLEHAFDACVGVSPARYQRVLRLHHARRLLESGRYSVTDAAIGSGLPHLGRMSAAYRELFDEFPSVTASRSRAG